MVGEEQGWGVRGRLGTRVGDEMYVRDKVGAALGAWKQEQGWGGGGGEW